MQDNAITLYVPFFSKWAYKNQFSRWRLWWPFWISNQHNFSYFYIYLLAFCSIISFNLIYRVVFEEMLKIDFQDGHCGGHLGFPIGTILAIFIFLLPCKFQLKSPNGLGEEVKNWFSRWWLWWPFWISSRQVFCFLFIPVATS